MSETKRTRLNNSLLQPLERPALAWMAARMPSWMTSDMLTGIGVVGTLVIFVGYALSGWHRGFLWLASAGFIINWVGDSLDGTLARFRKQERPRYGFFIDHGVDCFSQPIIILGMGLSPFIRFEVACLTLVAYLMVSVFAFIRTIASGTLQIAYGGVGPTEARVLVLGMNTVMFFTHPTPVVTLWAPLTVFDLIMLAGFVGGIVSLMVGFVIEARRLGAEDPLRKS
jgi:archaetidylinositol phosphate synthase